MITKLFCKLSKFEEICVAQFAEIVKFQIKKLKNNCIQESRNVMHENGWKMICILIHAENIKYALNASQKSQKFLYYFPILILMNK